MIKSNDIQFTKTKKFQICDLNDFNFLTFYLQSNALKIVLLDLLLIKI